MITYTYSVIYHLFQTQRTQTLKTSGRGFSKLTFSQSVSILSSFGHPHFTAASQYLFYASLRNATSIKYAVSGYATKVWKYLQRCCLAILYVC